MILFFEWSQMLAAGSKVMIVLRLNMLVLGSWGHMWLKYHAWTLHKRFYYFWGTPTTHLKQHLKVMFVLEAAQNFSGPWARPHWQSQTLMEKCQLPWWQASTANYEPHDLSRATANCKPPQAIVCHREQCQAPTDNCHTWALIATPRHHTK